MITSPSDPRIFLRAVEPEDLELLYSWENMTELWGVGSTRAPYSRKQIYDYVASYSADIYAERQLRLMVCLADGGTPVGTVDLTDFSPADMRAQVGILIAPQWQRHGYAAAALSALTAYASGVLHMHQLYALVPDDNRASLNLFRRCGFKASGRLRSWLRGAAGSYHDVMLFQHLF